MWCAFAGVQTLGRRWAIFVYARTRTPATDEVDQCARKVSSRSGARANHASPPAPPGADPGRLLLSGPALAPAPMRVWGARGSGVSASDENVCGSQESEAATHPM